MGAQDDPVSLPRLSNLLSLAFPLILLSSLLFLECQDKPMMRPVSVSMSMPM